MTEQEATLKAERVILDSNSVFLGGHSHLRTLIQFALLSAYTQGQTDAYKDVNKRLQSNEREPEPCQG